MRAIITRIFFSCIGIEAQIAFTIPGAYNSNKIGFNPGIPPTIAHSKSDCVNRCAAISACQTVGFDGTTGICYFLRGRGTNTANKDRLVFYRDDFRFACKETYV